MIFTMVSSYTLRYIHEILQEILVLKFGLLILMSFVRVACFYVGDVRVKWSHDESLWRFMFSPGLKIFMGKGVFRSDGNYVLQE